MRQQTEGGKDKPADEDVHRATIRPLLNVKCPKIGSKEVSREFPRLLKTAPEKAAVRSNQTDPKKANQVLLVAASAAANLLRLPAMVLLSAAQQIEQDKKLHASRIKRLKENADMLGFMAELYASISDQSLDELLESHAHFKTVLESDPAF